MSKKTLAVAATALLTVVSASPRSLGAQRAGLAARRPAGDARPTFDRVVRLEESGATSANVSLGDVNGDGHIDVVLVKGRHWPLPDRVLLGDGKGGFAPAQDLGPASDRSYSGVLADLDLDNDLDVVISNDMPDPKLVYLNDGKGRFQVSSSFGRPEWSTRNVSVADMNDDRLPDIIVANRAPEWLRGNYICPNRGGGRFDAECVPFSKESATTITPADMNRDGRIDLVVPHRDGGQSHVYLREAGDDLRFRQIPFGPVDAAIRMTAAAHLDRDGQVDIVAIDERRGVAVYYGALRGYAAGQPISGERPTPYALGVADLDLDGRTDIIVGHVEAPSTVYFNEGGRLRFVPVTFGDNQGTAYGFAIADVDEDGTPDIALARSEAPNVLYLATPARRSSRQQRR
jgi:hypothetical protein